MFLIQIYFLTILLLKKCDCEMRMEPFVVGGEYTSIENHPYCASLGIGWKAKDAKKPKFWSCGSSIINQNILLTAAHCLEDCGEDDCKIIVHVGHTNKVEGKTHESRKYKVHEYYDPRTIVNDLAIIYIANDLQLNRNVSRVILMRNPPYSEQAVAAGWGIVDDYGLRSSNFLKHLKQKVILAEECSMKMNIPPGTICASKSGNMKSHEYAAEGDSGSALVVRKNIQIGIVSYKNKVISKSLVVYTDVAYFYDWIQKNAEALYCKYALYRKNMNLQ